MGVDLPQRGPSRFGAAGMPGLQPGGNRLRRGRERLLDHAQDLLALAFDHRLQAAELEPCELDASGATQRLEPEIRQEVGRKDRLVDLEALVLRVALPVAKRERLECLRTSVPRIADRREEE